MNRHVLLGILTFPVLGKRGCQSGAFQLQAFSPGARCCTCAEVVSRSQHRAAPGTVGGRHKPSGVTKANINTCI